MVPVLSKHIEVTAGVCGGKPRIAGHRIRVQDVVVWHDQLGLSPDEIVSNHPTISLSDVYAALAYYHDHQAEIREQMEQDDRLAAVLRSGHPSKLIQKLAGGDVGQNSVSSG